MKEKKAEKITLFHTQSPEAKSSYDPSSGLTPENQKIFWKRLSCNGPMFLPPEVALAVQLYRGHQIAQAHNETIRQKCKTEKKLIKLKPAAAWASKQKARLCKQLKAAGGKKKKYTDDDIIKVFRTYKGRNKNQLLTSAIERIITENTEHQNEYLNYKNPETLLRRLKPIARSAGFNRPCKWWKGLKAI